MEGMSKMQEDVIVFKGRDVTIPHSLKMTEDPFKDQYGDGIIEPPFSLETLAQLPDHSNILPQCIEAMETNIDGFGFMLEPIGGADPEKDGVYIQPAVEERTRVLNFFEYCNPEIPYSQVRRRVRRDLEATGNGYWEIIRDASGDIAWIEHIESHTMRLMRLDPMRIEITLTIRDEESNEFEEYPYSKSFRRFVQIRNGQRVYFKEFGDPRTLNSRTGKYLGEEESIDETTIPATEIIHFKIYSPHSPYGAPRWIGNLLAVYGSRQAEEVNYEYFENNTVPPLALLVSGKLGEDTVRRLQDFVDDHMRGRKGFHKMLVVEASPGLQAVPGFPAPRASLEFQPLSDAQQKDALFDNYDRTNREKLRSSFRLPPIFVGLTSDYTRATAHESRSIAEEQVFAPEREDHDFVVNRLLFPAMKIKYWKYKSLAPDTNDVEVMSAVLESFCRCGLTVGEARNEMARLLNRTLPMPEGEVADWINLPLQIYLAKLHGGESSNEVSEDTLPVKKDVRQSNADLFLSSLRGIEKSLKGNVEDGASCDDVD